MEFHASNIGSAIYYRIGVVGTNSIAWRSAKETHIFGSWPAVALNKDGYVIIAYSAKSTRAGSQLLYRVGKIDLKGDANQSIEWKTGDIHWDGGFHSSIAVNDNGYIVGVHESNADADHKIFYRVGSIANFANGNCTIQWLSGHFGQSYDWGINPHIAINNHDQVVSVHEVPDITGGSSGLLHYRRGRIVKSNGTARIDFLESVRYESSDCQPAVALSDNGMVLALDRESRLQEGVYHTLYSRVGWLRTSHLWIIDWSPRVQMGRSDRALRYPAVATNGKIILKTHEVNINILGIWTADELHYSTAAIPENDSQAHTRKAQMIP